MFLTKWSCFEAHDQLHIAFLLGNPLSTWWKNNCYFLMKLQFMMDDVLSFNWDTSEGMEGSVNIKLSGFSAGIVTVVEDERSSTVTRWLETWLSCHIYLNLRELDKFVVNWQLTETERTEQLNAVTASLCWMLRQFPVDLTSLFTWILRFCEYETLPAANKLNTLPKYWICL